MDNNLQPLLDSKGKFAKGNPGSGVAGLGRPPKDVVALRKKMEERAIARLARAEKMIMKTYLENARKSERTNCHAVDKLIPTVQHVEHSGPGGDAIALQVQLIAAILEKT